jgi:hypothetical protein
MVSLLEESSIIVEHLGFSRIHSNSRVLLEISQQKDVSAMTRTAGAGRRRRADPTLKLSFAAR